MKEIALVTAIGTAAATTVVQQLKKNAPNIEIIGADINEKQQIVTSKDVDEFYQFPSAVSEMEKYLEFLKKFCVEKKVTYVFSIIDEEVYNLTQHREDFEKLGVKICLPDIHTITICHMKNIFVKWIIENMPEIAIKTYQAEKPDVYPVFVKPIQGRASIGCQLIDSDEEFQEFKDKYGLEKYIVQEYCKGEIITADISRDKENGIINICQRVEKLRNGNGCGIAVEIIEIPELNCICKKLAEKLDLNGVINAEFFRNKNGFQIIEINPRFSAGISYSCMADVNVVLDALYISKNVRIQNQQASVGKKFARRYETYEL